MRPIRLLVGEEVYIIDLSVFDPQIRRDNSPLVDADRTCAHVESCGHCVDCQNNLECNVGRTTILRVEFADG